MDAIVVGIVSTEQKVQAHTTEPKTNYSYYCWKEIGKHKLPAQGKLPYGICKQMNSSNICLMRPKIFCQQLKHQGWRPSVFVKRRK